MNFRFNPAGEDSCPARTRSGRRHGRAVAAAGSHPHTICFVEPQKRVTSAIVRDVDKRKRMNVERNPDDPDRA